MTNELNTGQRLANAVRWRSKTLWRRTLGRAGYERRQAEAAAKPSLARVAQLVVPDATPDDLALAGRMLDALLPTMDRPSRATLGLIAEHTILMIERNLEPDVDLASVRIRSEASRAGGAGLAAASRVVNYLRDSHRHETAVELARLLFDETRLDGYATLLHALQLRSNDLEGARETSEALDAEPGVSYGLATLLHADERTHLDDFETALAALETVRPSFDRGYSRRRIRAHESLGQPQQILDYLERFHANLPVVELATARFDAYFALGQRERAEAELGRVNLADADERVVDRIVKAHGREAARGHLDQLAARLDVSSNDPDQLEEVGVIFFRSNRPNDAIKALRRADRLRPLRPRARQALAQSLYSVRDFEAAFAEAGRLRGTERHWAGMKLQGRVLIQLGRPEEALENRLHYGRPGDDTDQVHYHALLSLRRYDEAFRLHPFVADLRSLRADFGPCAEVHPLDYVERRFIVADAGPGDELQDASLFAELVEMSGELITTCDPRLHTLLVRSFPKIQFIPVERLRDPPHFASHAPDAVPRSGRSLDRLLTIEADEVAATCDRVALGRGVKTVRDLSKGPKPAGAFVVPDIERVQRHRADLGDELPTVGIVWRSELQTSWRAIHYLDVSDLAPLTALAARFVCLQHDVSTEERTTLDAIFGDRITFMDSIDLRDDFEESAALVAALDLTIGVGTTMTNLSAAVGSPTLMLQTTHFGSWLATDERGTDFWYQSCTVLVADPPYDTAALISNTVDAGDQLLRTSR